MRPTGSPSREPSLVDLAAARRRREYHEAIRLLLEGTCGVNVSAIHAATGIQRRTLDGFLRGSPHVLDSTVDEIAMFVWKRLNAHLLLGPEDFQERT